MRLGEFIDGKTLEIVDFLLDNPVMDYSKKDIAEMSSVSRSTVHRKWEVLEQLGIVKETRKYQNTQLYSLNEDSEIVNTLGRLLREVENKVEQEKTEEAAIA